MSGPYAFPQAVTLTGLEAYMAGGASPSRLRGVVYRDQGGRPGALVAVTSETSTAAGAAAAWVGIPLAAPAVIAAGSYWLGYWYADGNGRHAYVALTGSERYAQAAYSVGGAPPATFPSASTSSSSYSLYAIYVLAVPPASSTPPSIAGNPQQGTTLTASAGTWTGSPTSTADVWLRCDAAGGNCTPIPDAGSTTYQLVETDVGATVRVAVTATNDVGSATAVSAPTAVVTASPPGNTIPPEITGTAQQGQTLAATTGSWTGDATSYGYRWSRCDGTGGNCTAIAGASEASYVLAAADVGSTIRVAVTAGNGAGSTTAVSLPTAVVAAAQGGTFGQSAVGTLVDDGGAGYLDVSGPYAVSSAVSVTALNAYVAGGSSTSHMRAVIYRDDGGEPGQLVAVTPEVTTPAGAPASWTTIPFAAPVALGAGSYWIGYWYADANGRRYFVTESGSERYTPATYSSTGNPPAAFGSASSSSSSYSLTATYRAP